VVTRRRRDSGQAAVLLVIVVCVVFAMSAVALATLGRDMTERTRAQSAADAAALAGLVQGRGAGEEIAARHGASVVSWTASSAPDGQVITAVVRLGNATATARASDRR
jgi:Tfp pilus assembly protein PilX